MAGRAFFLSERVFNWRDIVAIGAGKLAENNGPKCDG
jgi:hypothetical protein